MWREEIVPKYKKMLVNLNKGNPFTYEMVRVAVTTGNANVEIAKEDKSFIGIWQEYIYHLQNDDNGKRYSTSDSYISALKSFQKFLGKDAIKGFNISVAEIQKWKDCMSNGVKGRDGNIEGQLSDTRTVGRKDFEEFGRRIGLSERLIKREMDFFAAEHPLAKDMIDHSFLSESLIRSFWLSFNYRRATLGF